MFTWFNLAGVSTRVTCPMPIAVTRGGGPTV